MGWETQLLKFMKHDVYHYHYCIILGVLKKPKDKLSYRNANFERTYSIKHLDTFLVELDY
jgi:hypothetical protein